MTATLSQRKMILVAYRLASYELEEVDALVEWFHEDSTKRKRLLERLSPKGGPDDRYVDDFETVKSVKQLNSELSLIALWRCVELCRKRVIQGTLGNEVARKAWTHTKAVEALEQIGVADSKVQSWKTVDELRCLNNSIKHSGYVEGPLAKHKAWSPKRGDLLDGLDGEYPRLRLAAEEYIKDLTMQASKWLMTSPA